MTKTEDRNGNGRIKCELCGAETHVISTHLDEAHEGVTLEQYKEKFPTAPVMSKRAEELFEGYKNRIGNEKIQFNIKKTFGVNFKQVKTVTGWQYAQANTPAIDPDYVFEKTYLRDILYVLENRGEMALFTGPTGSGKSSVITQACARLNLPVYRVNFDAEITRADIVGQWILVGKEMQFQYGLLPKAMREGAVMILDEWDCANPSVAMVLQAVLEGGKLTITETGEVIEPHEDFRLFATSNTLGLGDETGLYNGTQPQNYAQLDRFGIVEIIDYPGAKVEKEIITKKTGLEDTPVEANLTNLITVAHLVRGSFKAGEIMATMSTRTLVNIAKKLQAFGDPKTAFSVAFLNRLNSEDRKVCAEFVQRIWGIL